MSFYNFRPQSNFTFPMKQSIGTGLTVNRCLLLLVILIYIEDLEKLINQDEEESLRMKMFIVTNVFDITDIQNICPQPIRLNI